MNRTKRDEAYDLSSEARKRINKEKDVLLDELSKTEEYKMITRDINKAAKTGDRFCIIEMSDYFDKKHLRNDIRDALIKRRKIMADQFGDLLKREGFGVKGDFFFNQRLIVNWH